jgi:hypothetical protein
VDTWSSGRVASRLGEQLVEVGVVEVDHRLQQARDTPWIRDRHNLGMYPPLA